MGLLGSKDSENGEAGDCGVGGRGWGVPVRSSGGRSSTNVDLESFAPRVAIASSGVTHATLVNWEYHDIIRRAADPECSRRLQEAVRAIDHALGIPRLRRIVKGLFGLAELEHDDDFASLIEVGGCQCRAV